MFKVLLIKELKIVQFMKLSNNHCSTRIKFDEYDEWGTFKIDRVEYDFHIDLDECGLSICAYGLTEPNAEGIKSVNCDEEYKCEIEGDVPTYLEAWGCLPEKIALPKKCIHCGSVMEDLEIHSMLKCSNDNDCGWELPYASNDSDESTNKNNINKGSN